MLVGFRTVELTSDYALVVNGIRAPIKGWNWCPLDPLYGVPRPEKLQRLLVLAAASGANLVRVWGGGLIETDGVLRPLRPARAARLAGVQPVELRDRQRPVRRSRVRGDARRRRTRDRAAAPPPAIARDLGRRERARRRRLDAGARGAARRRPRARSRARLARELAVAGRSRPARAVGAPGSPQALRALRLPRLRAAQRVRRRGHDEPRGPRGADPGGGAVAGRPDEPRLRAPRRVVEQRSLRAGGVRRPDRRPRDNAPRLPVAAVRRPSLRGRGEPAARRRGRSRGSSTSRYPNAWCTAAVDYHGLPKPAYWGVRRAYAGAPSASFATCAWGGDEEVRARVWGDATARIVELDGGVVVEAEGEIAVPVAAIAGDVFLLDLEGRNRYVMTTTENLAPLLDLPPVRRSSCATGCCADLCRPGRRSASFAGDVVDLLPGESGARRLRRRAGGMECSRLARSHPTARRCRAFGSTARSRLPTRARSRSTPASASALELQAADEPRWLVPGVFYGENRPEGCRRLYPRFTPGRVDVARMESDSWSFRADRCATPAVFGPGGGLLTARGEPARAGRRRLRAARRRGGDLARLPVSRGAAPLRRLGDPRAVRRAHAPLAAGRAGRARVRGARRRRPRARASRTLC